ncbi:C-signal [Bemisia tabaci]|uniref:C-signal n=1 Tax=Bemisia tabaci TaxID=7038 RepID=UPI003B27C53D
MANLDSVLITGASRGIGLEFVKQFLSNPLVNIKVIIAACRSPEKATALQDLKKSNSHLHVVQLDVCKFDSYDSVVGEVRPIVGDKGLTLLINNAGIMARPKLDAVTAEQMLSVLSTNTVAPVLLTKAFLPLLTMAAKVNAGKVNDGLSISRAGVINITSSLASIKNNESAGYYGYRESKAALNMSTQSLSIELKPQGILVQSIHPGWVRTDMGGPKGEVDVVESVTGMLEVMLNLKENHKTGYYDWKGRVLPF